MTAKQFLKENPTLTVGAEAVTWFFSNKKKLNVVFKELFPKSPNFLVLQLPTKKGTALVKITNKGETTVIRTSKIAYLKWSDLARSVKRGIIK